MPSKKGPPHRLSHGLWPNVWRPDGWPAGRPDELYEHGAEELRNCSTRFRAEIALLRALSEMQLPAVRDTVTTSHGI